MNEELDIDPLNPPSTDFFIVGHKVGKAHFATLTLSSLQQWAHVTGCIRENLYE